MAELHLYSHLSLKWWGLHTFCQFSSANTLPHMEPPVRILSLRPVWFAVCDCSDICGYVCLCGAVCSAICCISQKLVAKLAKWTASRSSSSGPVEHIPCNQPVHKKQKKPIFFSNSSPNNSIHFFMEWKNSYLSCCHRCCLYALLRTVCAALGVLCAWLWWFTPRIFYNTINTQSQMSEMN